MKDEFPDLKIQIISGYGDSSVDDMTENKLFSFGPYNAVEMGIIEELAKPLNITVVCRLDDNPQPGFRGTVWLETTDRPTADLQKHQLLLALDNFTLRS